MSTQKNEPRALALGVAVYIIWGFFPLYFSLLSPAGAVEVIVHRAVWGLFFCLVALAVTRSLGKVRALIADRGALWRLAVAGALVVVNWSVYVYAVLSGHTTDAAIGYFINPLVTIALGLMCCASGSPQSKRSLSRWVSSPSSSSLSASARFRSSRSHLPSRLACTHS